MNKNKISHKEIHLTLGLIAGNTGGRQMFSLEKAQMKKPFRGGIDWHFRPLCKDGMLFTSKKATKHLN